MTLLSLPTASPWKLVVGPVARGGGALLLLLVGGLWATSPDPGAGARLGASSSSPRAGYRLTLMTDSLPNCYYGSAWNDGEVVLPHDASDGKTVTLTSRYDFEDGCTWEATEILTPNGAGYSYTYVEHHVACEEGATPAAACARSGIVRVAPND
jgi:hypothetical protein